MPSEVDSMFYTGRTPWHGQGTKLEEPPTAAEAIRAAGLNWKVEKRPLFTSAKSDSDLVEVPGFSAVARKGTNRILGVVGRTWQPLQNRDAFKFFDPFVRSGAAEYHTAGALKGGRYVWVLAKLKGDPMVVAKGDYVEKFLLLSNSHDGKSAINVRFTPVRVVCMNTLTMAEGDDAAPFLRIRHAGNVKQTMKRVQEVVNITNRSFEATVEQYRFLARRQVQNIYRYVLDVLQVPNDAERPPRSFSSIIELFECGRGQENPAVRGSMWCAFNAVAEWVDYERGRDSTRLHAAWYGEGRRIKQRALEIASDLSMAA